MLIVPTSNIILLKNPIEMDYMNELTFASKTAQYNYFHGLTKLELENATYQRENEVVRFPTDPNMEGITFNDLLEYNYCMYQNDKWSNKWFYAFIKEVIFDNPGMSYIKLETDVWQTWCFDITFKNSFIEREHVNDDTIGKHTIPENLEMGELVTRDHVEKFDDTSNFKVCFGVTETPDENIPAGMNKNMNGIYGGLYYFVAESFADADKIIRMYDENSKADSIVSIFMIPLAFCELQTHSWTMTIDGSSVTASVRYIDDGDGESIYLGNLYIDMPSAIGTYTPKNGKMLTYPYMFVNATNNVGLVTPFRFEDTTYIDDLTNKKAISLWIEGCLTPGVSAKAIPMDYKNIQYNYFYSISVGKFPVCSWISDTYINWLTQNGTNVVVNAIGSLVPNVVSASAGNVGGFTGSITGIYNALHQFTLAQIAPDQAKGNINSGDINFSYQDSGGLSLELMTIKEEYAKIIDDYFSMFGYKVNSVKLPNINGRRYWNYVKTIGCNLIADIPQKDIEKIKEIFNNGITFWHDPSKFLDYSQSNTIVT